VPSGGKKPGGELGSKGGGEKKDASKTKETWVETIHPGGMDDDQKTPKESGVGENTLSGEEGGTGFTPVSTLTIREIRVHAPWGKKDPQKKISFPVLNWPNGLVWGVWNAS